MFTINIASNYGLSNDWLKLSISYLLTMVLVHTCSLFMCGLSQW